MQMTAPVFVVLLSQCLLFSSFLAQAILAAPSSQDTEDVVTISLDVKRDAEYRNALFGVYVCRVLKVADAVRTKLQSMTEEECHAGQSTALSADLQQRYDSLPSPQCTDVTYMNTYLHKLLLMSIYDADVRNILCHLSEAIPNLNRIHVDLTGSSCPIFSYVEYLQMYNHIASHQQTPVSKYCILKTLNENIRNLITIEGRGLTTDIFPPCNLGRCSNY